MDWQSHRNVWALDLASFYTPRRINYFKRLAQAKGVPRPFVEDAVQDIIVDTWIRCPEGRGWWQQARWSASRAAERYGTLKRTGRRKDTDKPVQVTTMDVLKEIPEEQWWIVDKVLDFRAGIATLTAKEVSAVEAIADSEQGSKKAGKKALTAAVKQNLRRARRKLTAAVQ